MKIDYNLSTILRYLLMVLSIFAIYKMVDFNKIIKVIKQIPLSIIFLSFVLVFIRLWLLVERWIVLSHKKLESKWLYFKVMLASGAANLFLPGIFGSDIIRSIIVANISKKDSLNIFLSVYVDRIVGLVSILIMGLMVSIFVDDFRYRFLIITISLISLFIITLVVWLSRNKALYRAFIEYFPKDIFLGKIFFDKIDTFIKNIQNYKVSKRDMFVAFLLCFLIHTLWFLIVWLVSYSIDVNLSFFVISLVTIIVWIASLLPLTIAGLGLRELGFIYLLNQYGVLNEQSITIALFQSFIIIIMGVIGMPFAIEFIKTK